MGCRRRAGAGAAVGKRPTGRRPVLSECGGGDGRGRLLSRTGLRGEPAPRRRGGGGGVPCVVDGARQRGAQADLAVVRSEEHTSELQSPCNLVCRLLLEKKKKKEVNDIGIDVV